MYGLMDERTNVWIDRLIDTRGTDRQIGQTGWDGPEGRAERRTDRRLDGKTDGQTNGQTKGRTESQTEGWTGGQTDGQTNRHPDW